MVHPMLKLLATQPELLAEHVAAYAELASAEASEAAQGLRQRTLLGGLAALLALLGLIFSGVAALLLAALPLREMPLPWVLLAVPAVPLIAALGCWLRMRTKPSTPKFVQLRQQVAADTALLREALAT
ncbi:phage holin family protein [Pseudaquabacterium terrae]|nr:phage holin family protein [Aquabacterium terrae]